MSNFAERYVRIFNELHDAGVRIKFQMELAEKHAIQPNCFLNT